MQRDLTRVDRYQRGDQIFLEPLWRDAPHLDHAVAPAGRQVVGAERVELQSSDLPSGSIKSINRPIG